MKRIIVLTALSIATVAGAAQASTDTAELQKFAPNADLSTLTDTEVATLINLIHNGDSAGEKRAQVQAFLN